MSIHNLLAQSGVPAEELELMDDAQLTVYRMNNLSPEIRKRFISDMGFVADYLNEGTFEGRKDQEIIHLEALCDMMEALTGDSKFTEQAESLLQKERKGEPIMMCEYLNTLESRGEAKLTSLLKKLYDLGRDEEAKLAVRNMDARAKLYQEFRIPNYSSNHEAS